MNVKICDFGLSLIFPNGCNNDNRQKNNNFQCFQYAGKSQYKSPEINDRKPFDARAADTWAIGVMLFIMLCGIPPFEIAHPNDLRFQYIINGKLLKLIKLWKLEDRIPKDAQDLLFRIFKPEDKRITIKEMLNHPYFKKSRQLIVDPQQRKNEVPLPAVPQPSAFTIGSEVENFTSTNSTNLGDDRLQTISAITSNTITETSSAITTSLTTSSITTTSITTTTTNNNNIETRKNANMNIPFISTTTSTSSAQSKAVSPLSSKQKTSLSYSSSITIDNHNNHHHHHHHHHNSNKYYSKQQYKLSMQAVQAMQTMQTSFVL